MPTALLVFLLAVVFTAVLAVGQGLYWSWVARQEQARLELMRRLGAGGGDEGQDQQLFVESESDNAAQALGGMGERLEMLLTRADSPMTVSQLLQRMFIFALVGMVLGVVITWSPVGVVLALPLFFAPYMLLSYQANGRTTALIEQLPDTLELMARSMQAGMGLSDSFKLVAEEMPMPIAGEFGRIFEEVRFGRDYRDAFGKMLDRNPGVFDLRLMVSSILLQRETGGNLIEILEAIAGTIRTRFGFEAKVKAMTAEAKFTGMILAGLPLFVVGVLILINPEYLNPLTEHIFGYLIIGYAFSSYGMGLFIMREISNVEI